MRPPLVLPSIPTLPPCLYPLPPAALVVLRVRSGERVGDTPCFGSVVCAAAPPASRPSRDRLLNIEGAKFSSSSFVARFTFAVLLIGNKKTSNTCDCRLLEVIETDRPTTTGCTGNVRPPHGAARVVGVFGLRFGLGVHTNKSASGELDAAERLVFDVPPFWRQGWPVIPTVIIFFCRARIVAATNPAIGWQDSRRTSHFPASTPGSGRARPSHLDQYCGANAPLPGI